MPYYIVLFNWTDQGIRNAKDSTRRRQEGRKAFEAAGGKWLGFYYTFGQYDGVAIVEFPNDETALQVLLAQASQGNIRTTTLKAFSEAEFDKVAQRLP